MSSFGSFRPYKLTVDEIYYLSNGLRIREVKLIRSTQRGFNFMDVETNRVIFKKHFYPQESDRTQKVLTFWIQQDLLVDKVTRDALQNSQADMCEKIQKINSRKERRKLLYEWIKTDIVNLRQFETLIQYVS